MRSMRRWAAVGLVAVFVVIWGTQTDRDAAAQARKSIPVTRVYTGADGQSHAEEIELPLNGDTTEMMKATGVFFSRRAAPYFNDWHPGPRRQFVITLGGRAEIVMGDGQKVSFGPGHISLIEDTTGKGHTTRLVSRDDRITVSIPLADQRPDGEKRTRR